MGLGVACLNRAASHSTVLALLTSATRLERRSTSQQQFDITSATNSEVQQLNLLNAAEAQKLSEMQSQGTMQICLASQMTVANMEQRNAAAQDLNSAAMVQQQRAMNDTSAANEGNTWHTYIP